MKRSLQTYLESWLKSRNRKPLLVKGARQVGKSYLIKNTLKPLIKNFIEINFEKYPDFSSCFNDSLDPNEIIKKLELRLKIQIPKEDSILFFDEAQLCPQSIASLRYFYEDMPHMPVICAGSLIDFAMEKISVPVGRIEYAYLNPLSFEEFLINTNNDNLIRAIKEEFPGPFSPTVHKLGLEALRDYSSIGGMPEVVLNYIEKNKILGSISIQKQLLDTYYDDLPKYALKSKEYQTVAEIFKKIPYFTCKSFKMVDISGELKSIQIRHSLTLLHKAQLISPIYSTSNIPPSQYARLDRFKILFLDIGLMQNAIRFDSSRWLEESETLLNNGSIAEQFVGQQLLSLHAPDKLDLYYWERLEKSSDAEVDYILQIGSLGLPIEVKSLAAGRLNSLKMFLDKFKEVPFGVRFCGLNSKVDKKLLSLPHYALPEFYFLIRSLGLKEFSRKFKLG